MSNNKRHETPNLAAPRGATSQANEARPHRAQQGGGTNGLNRPQPTPGSTAGTRHCFPPIGAAPAGAAWPGGAGHAGAVSQADQTPQRRAALEKAETRMVLLPKYAARLEELIDGPEGEGAVATIREYAPCERWRQTKREPRHEWPQPTRRREGEAETRTLSNPTRRRTPSSIPASWEGARHPFPNIENTRGVKRRLGAEGMAPNAGATVTVMRALFLETLDFNFADHLLALNDACPNEPVACRSSARWTPPKSPVGSPPTPPAAVHQPEPRSAAHHLPSVGKSAAAVATNGGNDVANRRVCQRAPKPSLQFVPAARDAMRLPRSTPGMSVPR